MKRTQLHRLTRAGAVTLAVLAPAAFSLAAYAAGMHVDLTGAQEVPPVTTSAKGTGTITVGDNHMVSGSIKTTGIDATAAHIHEAAMGKNGPVIIPLTKDGDTFSVPPNAKLTDAQYKALEAGNLYVNVHSAAHKDGEIRAQLKPAM